MSRYGLFRFGGLNYAISLLHVQKILQNVKSYTLPRLPGAVSAVLVDDDQLVPVLDLAQVFGVDYHQESSVHSFQVVVESEYGVVALPSDMTGRIVAEEKGTLSTIVAEKKELGTVGMFVYQNEEYNILDINFLAIEMTQGFWQSQPDTGDARRHQ